MRKRVGSGRRRLLRWLRQHLLLLAGRTTAFAHRSGADALPPASAPEPIDAPPTSAAPPRSGVGDAAATTASPTPRPAFAGHPAHHGARFASSRRGRWTIRLAVGAVLVGWIVIGPRAGPSRAQADQVDGTSGGDGVTIHI